MHYRQWTVSVISTGHDLHDLRDEVSEKLIELNFHPLAFERPDFPVEPFVHSHDACLQALKNADIVILLIDKRAGGFYVGSSDITITEEEYNASITNDKIVIPFVRKKAWEDRFAYQTFKKNHSTSETYTPSYVDNVELLDFIERVHKNPINNYIDFFSGPKEIKSQIVGRLKGLSRYILERITEKQIASVKALKTSTGMYFSLGDVLEKGYFVEPPFEVKSGTIQEGLNISNFINILKDVDANISLLGGPGFGKSTLIAKAFIEHAESSINDSANRLPFFLSLRSRGADYSFEFDDYLNESFKEFLRKEKYPLLNLDSIYPVFYIDGFDELTEDIPNIDHQKILQSSILSFPFVLSCRSRFAKNHLNKSLSLMTKFNYILELKSWGDDICSKYIEVFCTINNRTELVEKIIKYLTQTIELKEIISNPLLVTLFLWIIEEGGLELPLDIKSKNALFEKCLDSWVKKELSRSFIDGTIKGRELERLVRETLEIAAWEIYLSRFHTGTNLSLSFFNQKIKKIKPESAVILEKEIFSNLIDINLVLEEVKGMLHEFFLEHLAASAIIKGFQNKIYPFPNCLNSIIRPEINQIVRSVWKGFDENDLTIIGKNLWEIYFTKIDSSSPNDIILRNQAAYYFGRIENEESVQILINANKIEQNITVKLSIFFGLIKKLNKEAETELLNKLKKSPEWDKCNRGYHLLYYYDWKESGLIPPYSDPENIPWLNTFENLLRHITSAEKQHIFLRRIELFTIKRFIETRNNVYPLTFETLGLINKAISSGFKSLTIDPEFSTRVEEEFNELKIVWDDYKVIESEEL